MANARVAYPYVKSLLVLAKEHKALDAVHEDMLLFSKTAEENRSLVLTLRNPIIKSDKKEAILKGIFGKKVNPLTMAFFAILCKKGRENILVSIADFFHKAYNIEKGIGTGMLVTAGPVDQALREEMTALVKKLSGKQQIELEEKVDESMIGGFVLSVGDRQVDASVKNKLNALKIKFSQNPFVKEF